MSAAPSWADAYVGIPFADKGRARSGCDCWGLVRLVYCERLGIVLHDFGADYASAGDGETISRLCEYERGRWRRVGAPLEYDAVLLRIRGIPWHVGVMIDSERMLHVQRGCDAVIEHIASPFYRPRVEGFYRYNV